MKINLKRIAVVQAVIIALLLGYTLGNSGSNDLASSGSSISESPSENSSSNPSPTPTPVVTDKNGWPTSPVGRWENTDLQEGYPGYFVVIKRDAGDFYTARFFDVGQNGSTSLVETATLEDVGGGVLSVTWSNGDVNSATWGVRNEETASNMIDSWYGDIWFDCSEYIQFAQSRAQCDFFWSGPQ